MRRTFLLMMGLASGLVLPADVQAKPAISVNASPGANFSAYRSYAWVKILQPTRLTLKPVTYQRIISDFESALASKGYQKAESADLSLTLTIGAQEKTAKYDLGNFGGPVTLEFAQGPVSLDVFDTKTQKLLWQGQVIESYSRTNPIPAIDSAIRKLMQRFPATAAVPASSVRGDPPTQN